MWSRHLLRINSNVQGWNEFLMIIILKKKALALGLSPLSLEVCVSALVWLYILGLLGYPHKCVTVVYLWKYITVHKTTRKNF